MQKSEQFDLLFKVVMVGDSGVGKTNLLSRFVDGSFSFDSKPTIGVEFATKTIQHNGTIIKNQIWDTAGQERFRAITQAYYKGAVGAIIAFDLTKPKTFENVGKWLTELENNTDPNILIMLIGNKSDLAANRQVSHETASEFATSHKLLYIETSAASGDNVEEAFSNLIKAIYETVKVQPPPVAPTKVPAQLATTSSEQQGEKVKQPVPKATKKEDVKITLKGNKKQSSQSEKKKGCC